MNLHKRILKARPVQLFLAWVASLFIRLVLSTVRWDIAMPAAVQDLVDKHRPLIACFWHGRLMLIRTCLPRGRTVHVLISEHRDGLLISRAVENLDIHTVASARRRGGQSALRTMLRLLADGEMVGITPDGPRGPRMRAKAGAVKTAQLSGAPLIPISGSVKRRKLLGTWDRFCLALPFSRGVILIGEPIAVPADASEAELERLRRLLEDRLNAMTADADRRFGQSPVEPAAARTKGAPGHARA